ncbi:MAG: 2-succinyl-5-enolpyruvyl-6-hydroxy-3-cyclohexene-1-carboxylic-acid synthase, partial [Gammaproteobacteria bacterium]|nr:2-succinyl-5-enolpyruvyl-6-hydroxy-3-cyclohexene-1-carboxylic-acid synthase [Gammaproteobacteria bacterium]
YPLVLVSADRPAELQDCGANQTIDQNHLFGRQVRGFFPFPDANDTGMALRYARTLAMKAVVRSRWPQPGPVHLNVPLREPLTSETLSAPEREECGVADVAYPDLTPDYSAITGLADTLSTKYGLIICGGGEYGDGFKQAVTDLAMALGCPILADPLSGLRFGTHERSSILVHYDAFLREREFIATHRPEWVLRFGGALVSKQLLNYLEDMGDGVKTLVVPSSGSWPDSSHNAGRILYGDPESVCTGLLEHDPVPGSKAWCADFFARERHAAEMVVKLSPKPLEAEIMAVLEERLPGGSTLFCGNSMVIRDVDTFLHGGELEIALVGNRGVSGIDGNVSTLIGLAASVRGPVVGLLGDLALYHDMNGLLAAREVNATLVVFNNGGGGIFEYLPQAKLPVFERYWLTPTHLELAKVADLYRLRHHSVREIDDFTQALTNSLSETGVNLIEVIVDRQQSVLRHRTYWDSVNSVEQACVEE